MTQCWAHWEGLNPMKIQDLYIWLHGSYHLCRTRRNEFELWIILPTTLCRTIAEISAGLLWIFKLWSYLFQPQNLHSNPKLIPRFLWVPGKILFSVSSLSPRICIFECFILPCLVNAFIFSLLSNPIRQVPPKLLYNYLGQWSAN